MSVATHELGVFRHSASANAVRGPTFSTPLSSLRARVTNHKDLLPGLDGRSATARRFRDLVNAFIADMGGLDRCLQSGPARSIPGIP
jgi:hypothetical protein